MNRIAEGYCTVPNPFNRKQVSNISLLPDEVDVIVFWTRNARPMLPYIKDLDRLGYRYYFQYSVLGYPKLLDRFVPPLDSLLESFITLSNTIGSDKVIWRYDPILLSNLTDIDFHLSNFERIAGAVKGYTSLCVVSVVDLYKKTRRRLQHLREKGFELLDEVGESKLEYLLTGLVDCADAHSISVASCAEYPAMESYGIAPGKCIDQLFIKRVFNIEVASAKDPGQRKACHCIISRDIGMYDSCLFGCQYCYAMGSEDRAKINYLRHDPSSPSLLGRYES